MRYFPQFVVDVPPSKTSIEVVLSPFCTDSAAFMRGSLIPFLKRSAAVGGAKAIIHQIAKAEDEVSLMVELLSYDAAKMPITSAKCMAMVYRNGRPIRQRSDVADAARRAGAAKDPSYDPKLAEAITRELNIYAVAKAGVRQTPTLLVNQKYAGNAKSDADLKAALLKHAGVRDMRGEFWSE